MLLFFSVNPFIRTKVPLGDSAIIKVRVICMTANNTFKVVLTLVFVWIIRKLNQYCGVSKIIPWIMFIPQTLKLLDVSRKKETEIFHILFPFYLHFASLSIPWSKNSSGFQIMNENSLYNILFRWKVYEKLISSSTLGTIKKTWKLFKWIPVVINWMHFHHTLHGSWCQRFNLNATAVWLDQKSTPVYQFMIRFCGWS